MKAWEHRTAPTRTINTTTVIYTPRTRSLHIMHQQQNLHLAEPTHCAKNQNADPPININSRQHAAQTVWSLRRTRCNG